MIDLKQLVEAAAENPYEIAFECNDYKRTNQEAFEKAATKEAALELYARIEVFSKEFIGLCADIAKEECADDCSPMHPCNRCRLVERARKRREALKESGK